MKRVEIVDLETLRNVCYGESEEKINSYYNEINGYNLLEKDFKSLTIQELNEFSDRLKQYEEFLKVVHEVFGFKEIPFSANYYFKEILQELKSKQEVKMEKEENMSKTSESEKNIDLSVPFYKLTYDVIEKLPHKDPRKRHFKNVMHNLNQRMPEGFNSDMVDKDFTIEKLIKEMAEFQRAKKR